MKLNLRALSMLGLFLVPSTGCMAAIEESEPQETAAEEEDVDTTEEGLSLSCNNICEVGANAAPKIAKACMKFGVAGSIACGLGSIAVCGALCGNTKRCVRHAGGKACVSNSSMWICDEQTDGHKVRAWYELDSKPGEVNTIWAPSQSCHKMGFPTRLDVKKFKVCVENEGCSDWVPAYGASASAADDNGPDDMGLAPLSRYWNGSNFDHFYTVDRNDAGYAWFGYGFEGYEGYLSRHADEGTVPIHRYWNASIGDHFYTTNWNEIGGGNYGYGYEGVAGHIYPVAYGGTVGLHRYWSSTAGDHYYTKAYYPNGFCYGHCYSYEGALGYVFP